MPVQPNKAIVGSNAFAHSSGIHQDGFLKEQGKLRDYSPGRCWFPERELLYLTARSGRHALKYHLDTLLALV